MKGMKKLLSILMVLTLVLSLGASAFAATVTVKGPENHTYVAYQVFTGTTANVDGKEVLAAIEWANPSGADDIIGDLKNDPIIGSYFRGGDDGIDLTSATKVAEVMGKLTTTAEKQALARVLLANKENLGEPIQITDGSTNLNPGYYVIEDTTDVDGKQDAKNEIVLEVVGNDVTVEVKQDVPHSEKKVKDINDTTGSSSLTNWQDGADWDIGDHVPFKLEGTLPSNYSSYTTYYVSFHDKQSDGLTLDADSVKVYVDDVEIDKDKYSLKTPGSGEGETFEVVFEDIKTAVPAAHDGSVIRVEYTSTLNSGAVIGEPGNPNEMRMEFSNNPGGTGKGYTPWDKVTVFTFKLDVDKVDGDKKPLAGAAFTLFKQVPTPSEYPEGQPIESLTDEEGKPVTLKKGDYYQAADGTIYQVFETTTAGNATNFQYKGLDDGNYLLVETVVPDGYNKADDITFTVTCTHTEDDGGANAQTMGTLTVDPSSAEITVSGANMETDVMNQNGLELPETGGIGTTIFYIVGAVLVAGAVILLVTKKRVSGMEK